MMEVGQLLRQTREDQKLSLADIEEQTKIRQNFLSALESGDWDDLPNPVVARGFLRKYATALGLNAEELLAQGNGDAIQAVRDSGVTPATQSTKVAQTPDYQPINLDLYDVMPEEKHRWRRVIGFLLALIPVAVLAYLLIQFGLPLLLDQSAGLTANPTATATLPPAGTPPATPLIILDGSTSDTPSPAETPEFSATETPSDVTLTPPPTATPSPTPSLTPTFTPTPIQQLTMRMEIIDRAWVRVEVDGELQIESLLEPVYVQEFVAAQTIRLRTGNAAGVLLAINGEELPPLGEAAEVVVFIWEIGDDGIVMMTPTPEPDPTDSPTIAPDPGTTETPTVEPNRTEAPSPTTALDTPTPEPPTPEPETTDTPTPEP
jgi:cytoskeleton protein RodZ